MNIPLLLYLVNYHFPFVIQRDAIQFIDFKQNPPTSLAGDSIANPQPLAWGKWELKVTMPMSNPTEKKLLDNDIGILRYGHYSCQFQINYTPPQNIQNIINNTALTIIWYGYNIITQQYEKVNEFSYTVAEILNAYTTTKGIAPQTPYFINLYTDLQTFAPYSKYKATIVVAPITGVSVSFSSLLITPVNLAVIV